MSEQTNARGNVRVFACGGCGVNIGHLLEPYRNAADPNVADMNITYVDTSRSNLRDDIQAGHTYLLDGLDGSGKVRKENHKEIANRTRDILQKHPALDLNIVIHSAAGGSGSVIGPSLVSELLDKQVPTIVLLVGSADTRLDADNTLKTLKSYEAIAKLREAPVVMVYQQNTRDNKRDTVDATMRANVVSLAILWSRNNREMDSKDLFNFLRFDRVTSFGPQLAHLSIIGPKEQLTDSGEVISVATLAKLGQDTQLDPIPEVQYVGYVADDSAKAVVDNMPTHFYVTDGIFDEVGGLLNRTLKNIEAQQLARVQKESLLNDGDQPTSTGLVI